MSDRFKNCAPKEEIIKLGLIISSSLSYLKEIVHPKRLFMASAKLLIVGICIVTLSATESIFSQQNWQSEDNFINLPLFGIKVYQKFVSTSREGLECPMYPSCSRYASQAVERYGPFLGAMMAADRLHRCNHDMEDYQLSLTSAGPRYLDPPEVLFEKERLPDLEPNPFLYSSVSQDSMVKLADDLMAEHNYEQAILEYRRIFTYFPERKDKAAILFKVFECFILSKKYLKALDWIRYIQTVPDLSVSDIDWAGFYLGYTYYILENYPKGLESFRRLQDSQIKDEAKYYEGLCYLKLEDYQGAEKAFSSISAQSDLYNQGLRAVTALSSVEKLRYKKPALAGLLSAVIPGAGYLYTKKPQSALAAFVTNGLFIWGAYSAFKAEEPGVGGVLSLFELGWYSGAIYGGVVSAYKYNLRIKKRFESQFELKVGRGDNKL